MEYKSGMSWKESKGGSVHNHSTYTCNQWKHYNEKYEALRCFQYILIQNAGDENLLICE